MVLPLKGARGRWVPIGVHAKNHGELLLLLLLLLSSLSRVKVMTRPLLVLLALWVIKGSQTHLSRARAQVSSNVCGCCLCDPHPATPTTSASTAGEVATASTTQLSVARWGHHHAAAAAAAVID